MQYVAFGNEFVFVLGPAGEVRRGGQAQCRTRFACAELVKGPPSEPPPRARLPPLPGVFRMTGRHRNRYTRSRRST